MQKLTIPEKLLILSIDDFKGVITATIRDTLRFGLAGALLAELALANRIELKDNLLTVTGSDPSGDSLFDTIAATIAAEKKARKLNRWISEFSKRQTIKNVAERLAERGVIRIEGKEYVWITPYEDNPQVDASAKYWVKNQLRAIVLAGEKAEAPDIALLSLLKACSHLRLVFTVDERKAAAKKVDALVVDEVFGKSVVKLLADIEVAAAGASI